MSICEEQNQYKTMLKSVEMVGALNIVMDCTKDISFCILTRQNSIENRFSPVFCLY